MVKAVIILGEREDRVVGIVKGKYGFKNKSDAINFIIDEFEQLALEPEIRPEYVKRIKRIEKEIGQGKALSFKNVEELKRHIENA